MSSRRLLSFAAAVLALGIAFVTFGSSARASEADPDYRLSSLRVFNRVVSEPVVGSETPNACRRSLPLAMPGR